MAAAVDLESESTETRSPENDGPDGLDTQQDGNKATTKVPVS